MTKPKTFILKYHAKIRISELALITLRDQPIDPDSAAIKELSDLGILNQFRYDGKLIYSLTVYGMDIYMIVKHMYTGGK